MLAVYLLAWRGLAPDTLLKWNPVVTHLLCGLLSNSSILTRLKMVYRIYRPCQGLGVSFSEG